MVYLLKHYFLLMLAIMGGLIAFGLLATVIDWIKNGCKGPLIPEEPQPEPTDDIPLPDNIEDLEDLFREFSRRKEDQAFVLRVADRAEELGDRVLPLDAAKLCGKRAYSPSDMAHAWLRFRHAAEIGCAGAQEALSKYESEHYMELATYFDSVQDSSNAIHFYRLAVKDKRKKAYLPLAEHLAKTAETAEEWQEAHHWAKMAESVKKGDPVLTVKTKLNTLLTKAEEAEGDGLLDDAIDCYIEAARMGNPIASGHAVRLLYQHWVSGQDYDVLREMMNLSKAHGVYDEEFLSMAKSNLKSKYFLLNSMYDLASDSYRKKNYEEALELALQGSDSGNAECAVLAATIYSMRDDHAAAVVQLKRAKHLARRKPFSKDFDDTLRAETILSSRKAFLDAFKLFEDSKSHRDLEAAIEAIQPAIDERDGDSAAAAAKCLFNHGQTSEILGKAIKFAELAIQLKKTDMKPVLRQLKGKQEYFLGVEAEKKENFFSAISHYEKSEQYLPTTYGYRRAVHLYYWNVDPIYVSDWSNAKKLVPLCKYDKETANAFLRIFDAFDNASPLAIIEFRENHPKPNND